MGGGVDRRRCDDGGDTVFTVLLLLLFVLLLLLLFVLLLLLLLVEVRRVMRLDVFNAVALVFGALNFGALEPLPPKPKKPPNDGA